MDETTNLKRATVSISYDLDYRFKKRASQKFRFEKGWYSKAMVEAMEMWLEYNEITLLKEGTGTLTRSVGMLMWKRLKENLNDNLDFETREEPLNKVLNCFSSGSHIKDMKYQISSKNLKISLESPSIKEENIEFMVDDLISKYIQPITIITRAGIEDITGNKYKINEFEVGNSNKIHLKRVKSK